MSRKLESNQRPTDYKSVALPTELFRRVFLLTYKELSRFRDCKCSRKVHLTKLSTNIFFIFFISTTKNMDFGQNTALSILITHYLKEQKIKMPE